MLELRDIVKSYRTASLTQRALDGVSVAFRDNEFVAILGQSGSGKTTLLNVIGGLDHFDGGDLMIDSVSTRDFRDRDWDAYRNNRVGFVFQSYNLIEHQSVLANVELALTLSGVSRAERRERALESLERVGLADHVHKRPSQLSGGQMQRVAIARALVNDPEIVLADEPTGALDSATSVQVMDLLAQIAQDRLVIMVTHNPELAHQYATRIVELADGRVVADSHPCPEDAGARPSRAARATSMSLVTAASLSLANLLTKKGRTIMTSFAGSIGIIGIAAILALANGINGYIARTEEETLISYPLTIQRTGTDLTSLLSRDDDEPTAGPSGRVSTSQGMVGALSRSLTTNDLASLKTWLDKGGGSIKDLSQAVEYSYDVTPQIYLPSSGAVTQVNPEQAFAPLSSAFSSGALSSMMSASTFHQMPARASMYEGQYDVVAGTWPTRATDVVLVLSGDGTLPDLYEYTLGLREHTNLDAVMQEYFAGQAGSLGAAPGAGDSGAAGPTAEASSAGGAGASPSASSATSAATSTTPGTAQRTYTYDQLMDATFKLVPASARYQYDSTYGVWTDHSDDAAYMSQVVAAGTDLNVVGIVRPKDSRKMILQPGLGYTPALTRMVIDQAAGSDIVRDQMNRPDTNVLSGRTFADEAAGAGAPELDLTSLFTVDTGKIREAFTVDPSKLNLDVSGLNLTGITPQSLPPIDLSGLDLSSLAATNPQIDLSGLDLSAVSSGDLTARFPQLANVDYPSLITQALGNGALREGASTAIATMMSGVITNFQGYYAAHAGDDPDGDGVGPDIGTLATDYLAQPDVQQTIATTLGSEEVIDSARLTQNLTAALGADPEVAQISDAVRNDLVRAIGSQVASQVASSISQALSSSLQQAMSSAMTQMMTAIQNQVSQAINAALPQMMAQMGDAMSIDEQAFKDAFSLSMTSEQLASLLQGMLSRDVATYESTMTSLGWADLDNPSQIEIYPSSFESKESIKAALTDYNTTQEHAGAKDKVIRYNDLVGLLMSSVTQIVDIISWMLIAFVSISLVVSSIMIAIITYISVLERKKEIGILRSVGASKRDIRHVFNAETMIEGLMAGLLGVGITVLICLPANYYVEQRFGVQNVAQLPVVAGLALIGVSVALTMLAGLAPAAKAARQDPVEALRSE